MDDVKTVTPIDVALSNFSDVERLLIGVAVMFGVKGIVAFPSALIGCVIGRKVLVTLRLWKL